ncbi:MAG: tRNA (guanosine(46)-N7)-methyltransferase TrmB [Pirellulales bacterium]|jgi:tRNA (guanine-N7-)-methyltransferase
MGRRALPKIKPDVDLSRHFLIDENLPNPWDPSQLFDNDLPLELEIGSGKGLFMRTASEDHPEHNFLGIEIAFKYAQFAGYRLAQSKIPNAVMVHGDALKVVRELIPDDSLAAVHVYFPDPWWKARHHRRRVMNEESVKQIQRILKPGGILHFWTDVEAYFEMALELLKAETTLEGPLDVSVKEAEHDLDYRTHFERRMRKNDLDVFRSEFRNPA